VHISCIDVSNGTCPYGRRLPSTSAPALSAAASADFAEVLVRVVAIEATNSDTSREYSWEVYIRSARCVGASATCAKRGHDQQDNVQAYHLGLGFRVEDLQDKCPSESFGMHPIALDAGICGPPVLRTEAHSGGRPRNARHPAQSEPTGKSCDCGPSSLVLGCPGLFSATLLGLVLGNQEGRRGGAP
jgi:hypothetical protein